MKNTLFIELFLFLLFELEDEDLNSTLVINRVVLNR